MDPLTLGEPFAEASDESIIASLAIFSRELIRRTSRQIVDGEDLPIRRVNVPLPVSRAAAKDYVRLVNLWNTYRAGTAVEAPPRPCPACRAEQSDFQFLSFDQYPYHACRTCGTWFVPQAIDDGILGAFFSEVPEARRISDGMMSGRDVVTRDSDRERIGQYFHMMRPLIADRVRPVRYLDIGCGVGHSVELAAELGWEALGEELSEVAVATARAKGRNVVLPGARDRSGQYDVVSLFETLEHITDPDPVLAEAARALAPAGIVIITVPNRASFEISILRERCFHVFGGFENVGHINLFDTRGIGTLLERHGLSLMFTDGQFSSDLAQVFSYLASSGQSALDVMAKGHMDFAIAEPAYTVLNNLGPALSCLERTLKRSPILIALACRTADRTTLEDRFAVVERHRHQAVHETIAEEARALLVHEAEYKATMQQEIDRRATMQQEIDRRDGLLEELRATMQQEIDRRDDLLEVVRARFDRTIERRVILGIRALVRLAHRLGGVSRT
jgi:2-polyprenyl-3-methyl-5-hydroxy-6-metoxy-1,4-benzoquinol methylase